MNFYVVLNRIFVDWKELDRMSVSNGSVLSRRGLSWILGIAFAFALVMGAGPGTLLVNKPTTVLGLPMIYAWGLLWYLVQMVIVLLAYFLIWSKNVDESDD